VVGTLLPLNNIIYSKLNKDDNLFDKMIKDGYSFINIQRDTREDLHYKLNIRVGENIEEKEEK